MFSSPKTAYRVIARILLIVFFFSMNHAYAHLCATTSSSRSLPRLFLPLSLGTIVSQYHGTSDQKVILIQDIHCNPETQRNIAGIIGAIQNTYRNQCTLIGMEGTRNGVIDTSILRAIPDRIMREHIAQNFIEQGKINGAELYAMGAKNSVMTLCGLEDDVLYQRNAKNLCDSLASHSTIRRLVSTTQEEITELKKFLYSQDALEIENMKTQYDAHTVSIEQFVLWLKAKAELYAISLYSYPAIALYVRASTLKNGLSMDSLQYMKYIEYTSRIDATALLDEADDLYYHVLMACFPNSPDARDIAYCSHYLTVMEQYLCNKGSRATVEAWQREKTIFFSKMQRLRTICLRKQAIDHALHSFRRMDATMDAFYAVATKREEILVRNLLHQAKHCKSPVSICVVGGFHRKGIEALLKSKGISYDVVMPPVPQTHNENIYRTRLQQQVASYTAAHPYRMPLFPIPRSIEFAARLMLSSCFDNSDFSRDVVQQLWAALLQKYPQQLDEVKQCVELYSQHMLPTIRKWRSSIHIEVAQRGRTIVFTTRYGNNVWIDRFVQDDTGTFSLFDGMTTKAGAPRKKFLEMFSDMAMVVLARPVAMVPDMVERIQATRRKERLDLSDVTHVLERLQVSEDTLPSAEKNMLQQITEKLQSTGTISKDVRVQYHVFSGGMHAVHTNAVASPHCMVVDKTDYVDLYLNKTLLEKLAGDPDKDAMIALLVAYEHDTMHVRKRIPAHGLADEIERETTMRTIAAELPATLWFDTSREEALYRLYEPMEKYSPGEQCVLFAQSIITYAQFCRAVRDGDLIAVRFFCEYIGADVNMKDERGASLLHYASACGKPIELATLLIRYGADVNATQERGNITPLLVAMNQENESLILLLLEHGADAENACLQHHVSFLHCAVNQHWYQVVEYVLRHHYSPNVFGIASQADRIQKVPFTVAWDNKDARMCELLVSYGATMEHCIKGEQKQAPGKGKNQLWFDTLYKVLERGDMPLVRKALFTQAPVDMKSARDENGQTMLHKAAESRNLTMIVALLELSSAIEAPDVRGDTPLQYAVRTKKPEVVELLIARGANKDVRTEVGKTLLHLAVDNSDLSMAKLLVEKYHMDTNICDKDGIRPLHIAIMQGNEPLCAWLISVADVNVVDAHTSTALHVAAAYPRPAIVRLLLAQGARADLRDEKGRTPAAIAQAHLPDDDDDDSTTAHAVSALRAEVYRILQPPPSKPKTFHGLRALHTGRIRDAVVALSKIAERMFDVRKCTALFGTNDSITQHLPEWLLPLAMDTTSVPTAEHNIATRLAHAVNAHDTHIFDAPSVPIDVVIVDLQGVPTLFVRKTLLQRITRDKNPDAAIALIAEHEEREGAWFEKLHGNAQDDATLQACVGSPYDSAWFARVRSSMSDIFDDDEREIEYAHSLAIADQCWSLAQDRNIDGLKQFFTYCSPNPDALENITQLETIQTSVARSERHIMDRDIRVYVEWLQRSLSECSGRRIAYDDVLHLFPALRSLLVAAMMSEKASYEIVISLENMRGTLVQHCAQFGVIPDGKIQPNTRIVLLDSGGDGARISDTARQIQEFARLARANNNEVVWVLSPAALKFAESERGALVRSLIAQRTAYVAHVLHDGTLIQWGYVNDVVLTQIANMQQRHTVYRVTAYDVAHTLTMLLRFRMTLIEAYGAAYVHAYESVMPAQQTHKQRMVAACMQRLSNDEIRTLLSAGEMIDGEQGMMHCNDAEGYARIQSMYSHIRQTAYGVGSIVAEPINKIAAEPTTFASRANVHRQKVVANGMILQELLTLFPNGTIRVIQTSIVESPIIDERDVHYTRYDRMLCVVDVVVHCTFSASFELLVKTLWDESENAEQTMIAYKTLASAA